MNPKIGWAATIVVIIIASIVLFFPQVLQDGGQTGRFTLRFDCAVNGNCTASETYADCPEDCCDADCTGDGPESICHASCDGFGGCANFVTGCDLLAAGTRICLNATTWTQCCSGAPTSCAAGEYCTDGYCGGCSTACDGACESAGCFGTDPDCGASGNPTLACCGNTLCDGSEDCTTCPSDCPGSVVCSIDLDCDDSNSLTVDTCNNPEACDSSCSNVLCVVACSADIDCDDSNPLTTDSCSNPHACDSACLNTPIGCTIECSSDPECDDANSLTVDTCSSPDTCAAACSNLLCPIACSANIDCDDSNSFTADACSSPATCAAVCTYAGCTPVCFGNEDCSDDEPSTLDTCNSPGTCDSSCSNVVCTPACDSDAECNDDNPVTADTCIHPGGCGAHCINVGCTPVCTSDASCDDLNPTTLDTCVNPGACNASCSNVEQYLLSFDFGLGFDEGLARGQTIDLNLLVLDDEQKPVVGADVYLSDAQGNRVDLDSVEGGFYLGNYSIPVDFPLGGQTLSFFAEKGGKAGIEQVPVEIMVGGINAVLLEPTELTAMVGEKLLFEFSLVYDNNSAVSDADVNAVLNGISIPLVRDEVTGSFEGHYLFSEADLEQAVLTVSAEDSFGNTGSTVFGFDVEQQIPWFFVLLAALLLIAVLLAFYGMRKTYRLSSLLRKMGWLSLEKRRVGLQMAIAREKRAREQLGKKIAQQEKELQRLKQEVGVERRKQAIAVKRLPMEFKYAVHKAAVSASLLLGKIKKRLFKPKKPPEQVKAEERLRKIDPEVSKLRDLIQNLESEYCKQTIKEDFFRQKLFEYREKIHLLELEKKKLE